jgi:hypothetical protein
MIFLIPAIAGLICGLAMGGRLSHLVEIEWHGLPLLLIAALVNVFGGFFAWKVAPLASEIRVLCLVFVYGSVGWVLWRSPGLWRPALLALTLGGFLNFLVMAANAGQMPVRLQLLRDQGRSDLAVRIEDRHAFRHVPLTPETPLGFLGDIIKLPAPFSVPSPGDVIMAMGIGLLLWKGLLLPQSDTQPDSPEGLPRQA